MKTKKITKSGTLKPRYSNELPVTDGGIVGDYSDVTTHQTYTVGSGSGAFNWGGFFGNLIDSTESVLTSIYGRNNQVLANAYNTMYEQEKRTNMILWVVIGLVVALGVFLVIRKTK